MLCSLEHINSIEEEKERIYKGTVELRYSEGMNETENVPNKEKRGGYPMNAVELGTNQGINETVAAPLVGLNELVSLLLAEQPSVEGYCSKAS